MNENLRENTTKLSKGTIVTLILVSLLIVGLILGAFFFSETPYVIAKPIIILVCLLVVIILGNRFDRINFIKIFELDRKIEAGNEKISKLDEKSERYFNQILSVNNHTQIINASQVQVTRLDPSEIKARQDENKQLSESDKKLEKLNINQFCELILKKGVPSDYQKDVALVDVSDSISNRKVAFDAVVKDNNKEIFIEVMKGHFFMLYFDRLYTKINKILSYKKINRVDAKLLLLIPIGMDSDVFRDDDKLTEWFEPAIRVGLLEIKKIEYSAMEYKSCLTEIKRRK